jgi:hypothetical protein
MMARSTLLVKLLLPNLLLALLGPSIWMGTTHLLSDYLNGRRNGGSRRWSHCAAGRRYGRRRCH